MTILAIKAVQVHDYRQLSDSDCMGALGTGDEHGLTEIVRRYESALTRYLARIVHDAERARDLAQETFVKIFRHRSAYRTTARFATWLFHIARNVARDELRSRRRRVQLSPGAEPAEHQALPGETPERLEMREVVVRALAQLSERDQALIVLRDVDGLSYEEVAERTGIPVGTVKSGLNRARARFRERFEALESPN